MPDPTQPSLSTRLPTAPPPWGFFKGLLAGSVIEVPALAVGVWLLGRLHATNPDADFMQILRLTAVFAGIAAVLTSAGIGRLAAWASVDPIGGRGHAMFVAVRAHAAASAALIVIATIPQGHLPDHARGWLIIPIVGAAVGAACGAVVGAICGGASPLHLGDVIELARTPGHALSQLLDPKDLVKLGTRMRTRTRQVLHGMFEPLDGPADPPTPKPPDDKPPEA
ncbi:MAG: hypothetical protein ABI467_08990 [Kofleriaceae bacterium]